MKRKKARKKIEVKIDDDENVKEEKLKKGLNADKNGKGAGNEGISDKNSEAKFEINEVQYDSKRQNPLE